MVLNLAKKKKAQQADLKNGKFASFDLYSLCISSLQSSKDASFQIPFSVIF